ncbi:serine/threonine-protein kinase [Nocardia sp. SYP-A9097]|uniref:serine/threonine-protein kinase n=1 Tax=Nocardia sp. SYP-A9097 TaxID=2663237 RepID=UPI00129A228E|nr:serine/threonine-protein kinase [Nocardia sp. SYP-A9097]
MVLRPGEEVAGYVIVRALGGGRQGTVYLARHPRLPRGVALKVIHDGFSGDPKTRASFDREVELVSRLDHPNVVAVYDRNGLEDTHLWLSMRYVAGGDLAALLGGAPGGLDPDRAALLIAGTAQALDYAHGQGVLHRDVKPLNILLEHHNGAERPVLTDFGIARALDDTVTASGIVATFAYAAPERFTSANVGHRSDVYSLGCTLFQLLTGYIPYPAKDPAAAIYAHVNEPIPSPRDRCPNLPPYLDAVLTTALAKNPRRPIPHLCSTGHRCRSCAHYDCLRTRPTTADGLEGIPTSPRHRPRSNKLDG